MLRSLFIGLSRNVALRRWAEQSRIGRRLASRFVAGLTVGDAVSVCRRVNAEGIAVSLDSLGESVTTEAQAGAAAEVYHRVLGEIAAGRLNANISLKLTQMGVDLRPDLAEQIVAGIVERAAVSKLFVRIDMEGSNYTETTIAMTERLHARFPGVVGTATSAEGRHSSRRRRETSTRHSVMAIAARL